MHCVLSKLCTEHVNLSTYFIGENSFAKSPVKDKSDREMRQMRQELQRLRGVNTALQTEKEVLVSDRLADADDEVRRMFENAQSQHYEERNCKDEEIRKLQHLIENEVVAGNDNFDTLQCENTDLRDRVDFLEKEIESKTEFIQKQTLEQESDRQAQDDRILMLQLALDKIKDKNQVII